MKTPRRWDPCISHRGEGVKLFVNEYFTQEHRSIFLLAGAGFDPRSNEIAKLLSESGAKLKALFIREERPSPSADLIARGDDNSTVLKAMIPDSEVLPLNVFGQDNAVVGGRKIIEAVHRQSLEGVTDVVVDISAFSIGISFPAIRYFATLFSGEEATANLHVMVTHQPTLDEAIVPVSSDSPGFIHSFKGRWGIDQTAQAAKLWLPQLACGRRAALRHLFDYLNPHETCPILPFPAAKPRLGDDLAEHFIDELDSAWAVDSRDIVFAAEDDPLDLYRTILSMDDRRKPVYDEVGGSLLVLSPVGSKLMALGALLAALERDLPVAYLESLGYDCDKGVGEAGEEKMFFHVWLEGEAYPKRGHLA
jgi:hypothetical protein